MVNQTCVALDLETTGFDRSGDAIIEVAAVKFQGQRVLASFHSLLNPRRPLPPRIRQLTGISQAEVDAAPPQAVVLGELAAFIGRHPLVGQNISFDLGFLAAGGLELPNLRYDTLELASILFPCLPDRGLGALAAHLGLEPRPPHRALPDALAAKDVFLALLERIQALNEASLAEILRLTAGREWALRPFFAHFAATRGESRHEGAASSGEDSFISWLPSLSPPEPLEEKGERRPLDALAVRAAFEPGGALSTTLAGFEHRPQQAEMAEAVAQALNDKEHLLVEAGPGTGKSLAYLLPTLLFAEQNGTRVVVSTNTINLQEQLLNKDIPDLRRALQRLSPDDPLVAPEAEMRVVALKGRRNYLCLRRWASLRSNPSLTPEELALLLKLAVWLPSSVSGDRAELNLPPEEATVWNRISAQADPCLGSPCAYREAGKCFLQRARRAAEAAQVVVVNHALLLSDLALGGQVLPEYRYLVIDEAHHLEDEATAQFGFQLSARTLLDYLALLLDREGSLLPSGFLAELGRRLRQSRLPPAALRPLDEVRGHLQAGVGQARQQAGRFFDLLGAFLRVQSPDSGEYDRRLRLSPGVRAQPDWSAVDIAADNLVLSLRNLEAGLARLQVLLEREPQAAIPDHDDLMLELAALAFQVQQLGQQLSQAVNNPEPDMVYWATLNGASDTVSLHAAPLEVGPILERGLFRAKDCVLLTSATMTTEGSFDYLRQRLGLSWGRELALPAPFDYLNSTLIYLPQDMPEPGQPNYEGVLAEALVDLCSVTQGRTLALFTSHAALRSAHGAIRRPLEEAGITVLGQGVDGSAKQLLAAFQADPQAVLLGAASFWEGVDVVGEALSVLVIARLPFSVPTEPVFAARSETFDDPFNEYALPQAALRFKQGFGRLIRSRSDRGVVVVLDRRVQSRRYGSAFLDSLPPCSVHRGPLRQLPQQASWWLSSV